ncbi:hypothetical protein [Jeotgalibacillus malaysiensis]|uniref:hypothetical protein n=1 Tax=Jeotgalibacillus malaysiensis TaxID=1508404 RepID=UPI003850463C
MTVRYIAIFIIGFIMTFFIPGDLFDHPNTAVSIFMRFCNALIILFLTWLLQPSPAKEEPK